MIQVLCEICGNDADIILMDKYHTMNDVSFNVEDINNTLARINNRLENLRMFPICKKCFETELKFINYQQKHGNSIGVPIRWVTWANYESIQFDRANRPYAYRTGKNRIKPKDITTRKYKYKQPNLNKPKMIENRNFYIHTLESDSETQAIDVETVKIAFYRIEKPKNDCLRADIRTGKPMGEKKVNSILLRQTDFAEFPISKIKHYLRHYLGNKLGNFMLPYLMDDLKIRLRTNQ